MASNRFNAKPVHLFVFTRQQMVLRYCTADRDLVIDGKAYSSAQIERSEIRQTVERAKDKVTIKFAHLLDPRNLDIPVTQVLGANFWPYTPADTVSVVCLAYDVASDERPSIEWMGRVIQPKVGPVEMELVCEPENGLGRARGQGMRWQRGCGKTVYSTGPRGCNLAAGAVAVSATVSAAGGLLITAPELAGAAFALGGGFVTFVESSGLTIRRDIASHALGDSIIALTPGGVSPAVGSSITAMPTCPRTWAACSARGNTVNFGGSLYKPVKNPMNGVSMSWG